MDIISFYNNAGTTFLWLLLIVCMAIIIREIALWYWKINRTVELLENIEKNTRKEMIESENKYTDDKELKNAMKKSIFD